LTLENVVNLILVPFCYPCTYKSLTKFANRYYSTSRALRTSYNRTSECKTVTRASHNNYIIAKSSEWPTVICNKWQQWSLF